MDTLLGVLAVAISGLFAGGGAWPFKLLRKYQFEHWWFIAIFIALFVVPWGVTLLGCPDVIGSERAIWSEHGDAMLKANLLSLAWGVANVLCGLCYVRIGVALTGAILAGLGVCVGTIMPLVFKGTGQFQDAAGLGSTAGQTVMAGVAVMLVGVILATMAGLGRSEQLKKIEKDSKEPPRTSGKIVVGLIMAALSGVLSAGLAMSSVYSQEPVRANLSFVNPNSQISVNVDADRGLPAEAARKLKKDLSKDYPVASDGTIQMAGVGAVEVGGLRAAAAAQRVSERLAAARIVDRAEVRVDTGSIPAVFGVTANGVIGGLLVNIGFAIYLLFRNKSWHMFFYSARDFLLSVTIAVNSFVAIVVVVKGMLWLGALGASVGFGIQQAMQMTGCQAVGFISGEWRGVRGKPRTLMYAAIAFLIVAAVIMVVGKKLGSAE
jgi:hypothetical protein